MTSSSPTPGDTGSRRRLLATLAAIGVTVALSRWMYRARGPDDYDSFSFLLGMRDQFDLARFQPQFPGYPVYVFLGRALIGAGIAPLDAATGITAAASGATAIALAVLAESIHGGHGHRAAVVTAALYLVSWLPLETGAGMMSEPLAVALAVAALALLVADPPRPALAGFVAGLLLGARASYWPLVVSFMVLAAAHPGSRRRLAALARHLSGLGLGLAVWLPAFVVAIGPRTLWQLGLTHLRGHFDTWGNTVVTRPDLGLRLTRFARDLFVDGLAPDACALAAVAVAVIGVLALRRARPTWRASQAWLVVLAPYALWAFFAQNVLTQPRHVLPLVVGLILLLGIILASSPLPAALAIAAIAVISLPLAAERQTTPPAPAQAAAWAADHFRCVGGLTAIFDSRSVRFFLEAARGWDPSWTVNSCGLRLDLYVVLARVDRFPEHIFLTDEIDLQPNAKLPGTLTAGPRFCRDERIDRAVACVQLYQLDWKLR